MRILKISFLLVILSHVSIWSCPRMVFSQDELDTAINNLTEQIGRYMVEQKKTKIAIIPFPDLQKQKVTVLGSFIAEELTTNLFATNKFKIIERSLLKQILDELKLGQTGIIDSQSAKELGKMTGVDAIIAGTIADLGSTIAVNCRLIETETGEVFAAAKARIIKNADISIIAGETPEPEKKDKPEKEEVGESRLANGNYQVEARELIVYRNMLNDPLIQFGFIKAELKADFLVLFFYAKNLFSREWPLQYVDAYIIDENLNRVNPTKIDGLDEKREGRMYRSIRPETRYFKYIGPNSRIWGTLTFKLPNLRSPEFLFYINGLEMPVRLTKSNQ